MRSLTILYVEDHVVLLRLMRELLETQGWVVETCRDGRAALERIEDEGHYDILVLDNDLPGMSGVELVQRARLIKRRKDTPILVLSANETVRKAALDAGADVFLLKPEDAEVIVETIRRLTTAH